MQRSGDRRAFRLPDKARPYRTIGPFDENSLPAGLRRTHALKEGSWGKLVLEEGALAFTWEDETGGSRQLTAPAELIVPPVVQHHVKPEGPIRLTITFYRE